LWRLRVGFTKAAAYLLNQSGYYLDHRAQYAESRTATRPRPRHPRKSAGGPITRPPLTSLQTNLWPGFASMERTQGPATRKPSPVPAGPLALDEKALGAGPPRHCEPISATLESLYRNPKGRYEEAEPLCRRPSPLTKQRWVTTTLVPPSASANLAKLYHKPSPLRGSRAAVPARPRNLRKSAGSRHPRHGI